jgi:hypothetical protein
LWSSSIVFQGPWRTTSLQLFFLSSGFIDGVPWRCRIIDFSRHCIRHRHPFAHWLSPMSVWLSFSTRSLINWQSMVTCLAKGATQLLCLDWSCSR